MKPWCILKKPQTSVSSGWQVQVCDGYQLTRNLTPDTLDSVVLYTKSTTTRLHIKRNDKVVLYDEIKEEESYWLVATYNEDVFIDDENVKNYTYQISLVDFTRLLEKIPLPNLTHKNNYGDNGLKISEVLKRVCNYQLKYLDVFDLYGSNTGNVYIEYNLPNAMNTNVCPDYNLAGRTMREYLDYMMSMVGGCRVLLRARKETSGQQRFIFTITYINPNERTGTMNASNCHITTMSPSEDSSTLLSELESVYSGYQYTEYQVAKSTKHYWDTDDQTVKLNHKVNYINKVYMVVPAKRIYRMISGTSTTYRSFETRHTLDITDFVIEQRAWNVKKLGTIDSSSSRITDFENGKKNYLYFSEGYDSLQNLYLKGTDFWGNSDTIYTYKEVAYQCLGEVSGIPLSMQKDRVVDWEYVDDTPESSGLSDMYQYFRTGLKGDGNETIKITSENILEDIYFKIWYNGDSNAKIFATQTRPYEHRIIGISSQQQALIDFNKKLANDLEIVNASGEDTLVFKGLYTFDNRSKLPKIGQSYDDDYVVSDVTYSISYDNIEVSGTLTKYFSAINTYQALDRKRRFTALAGMEESQSRHEVILKKCVVGLSNYTPSTVFVTKNLRLNYAKVDLVFNDTSNNTSLVMPITFKSGGNVLSYTLSFITNVKAGEVKGDTHISGTSRYPMENILYTDNDGELKSATVTYYKDIVATDNYELNKIIAKAPLILDSTSLVNPKTDLTANFTNLYKDNAEILSLTSQVDFVASNDSVIIGEHFAECLELGNINMKYVSYNITPNMKIWDVSSFTSITISNLSEIYNKSFNSSNGNLVLVNSLGELILGVNNKNTIYGTNYVYAISLSDFTNNEASVVEI